MLVLCSGVCTDRTQGQEVVGITVDRIVAIVGDTPISQTMLNRQIESLRSRGEEVPTEPGAFARFQRELLVALVDQELLIQAAERDTMVQVTEEEVQEAVDETIRNVRNNYPSLLDLERDLQGVGFRDLDDYRLYLAEQQRVELLQTAIIEQLQMRGDIEDRPPTDEELREYFEARRAQFGERPATVSFRQVVVFSKPDTAAIAEALIEVDSVRHKLQQGADFAEMARIHSDDPQTKDTGGDLGWFRRGQGMEREFEDVAFRLQPGVISFPVYTPFGFHLIEVLRAEPASVQARHVLIAPTISEEARQAAKVRADSVVQQLRDGVPYDSVVARYHEPDQDRIITDVPRDRLPQEYLDAIATAEIGDVTEPLEADRGNGRSTYTVMILQDLRPAGALAFNDVRDQLRAQLAQQNGIERFLQTLRDATYIEIRI
jgi:peptidyl-prolyl cis-trans isomerase SurA